MQCPKAHQRLNGRGKPFGIDLAPSSNPADPLAGAPAPWSTDQGETLQLSTRQLAVLQFLAKDKTNDFIAATLGVSVSTVKHDVQRILRALRSPDRRVAVDHAIALGILQPQ